MPRLLLAIGNYIRANRMSRLLNKYKTGAASAYAFWSPRERHAPLTRMILRYLSKTHSQVLPDCQEHTSHPEHYAWVQQHLSKLHSWNAAAGRPVLVDGPLQEVDTAQWCDIEIALLRARLEDKTNRVPLPDTVIKPKHGNVPELFDFNARYNVIQGLMALTGGIALYASFYADSFWHITAIALGIGLCAEVMVSACTSVTAGSIYVSAAKQSLSMSWDEVFQLKTTSDAILCGMLIMLETSECFHKNRIDILSSSPQQAFTLLAGMFDTYGRITYEYSTMLAGLLSVKAQTKPKRVESDVVTHASYVPNVQEPAECDAIMTPVSG